MTTPDGFRLVGSEIAGRYRIDAVIGEGGFGTVYRGWHLLMAVPIAVKCLRIPEGLTAVQQEDFLARFLREAKLMHELSRQDAGIVQAMEVNILVSPEGRRIPYLVLEWVDGTTLEDVIDRLASTGNRMTIAEVLKRLGPIARALGVAHEQGVAHRDIKPSNIMLPKDGQRGGAKLLDFGIAKVVQGIGGAATTRGAGESSSGFTPRYAAPEQWVARFGPTGPWTDVFSFALVCVECMTGTPALAGDDVSQWMGACLSPHERPTPRVLGLDLGEAVERVFLKSFELSPDRRYREVGEFWGELCDAARGAPQISNPPAPRASGNATVFGNPLDLPSQMDPRESFPDRYQQPGTGTIMPAQGRLPERGRVSTGGAQVLSQQYDTGTPQYPPPPAVPGHTTGSKRKKQAPKGLMGWIESQSAATRKGIVGVVALFLGTVLFTWWVQSSRPQDEPPLPVAVTSGSFPTSNPTSGSQIQTISTSGDTTGASPIPSTAAPVDGTLSVYCVPSCEILVDGTLKGASPLRGMKLPVGVHRVEARRAGSTTASVSEVLSSQETVERFW